MRGYSWAVIPITWRNRRHGAGKLAIREMGSRYLFICLYIWLEKYFTRGDYHKTPPKAGDRQERPDDALIPLEGIYVLQIERLRAEIQPLHP